MLALCFEKAGRPLARPGRHPGLAIPPDWWPTWRVVLKPRTTTNQSVLLSPHSNAKLSCGAQLASHDDACRIGDSPANHKLAIRAPSAAATRYVAATQCLTTRTLAAATDSSDARGDRRARPHLRQLASLAKRRWPSSGVVAPERTHERPARGHASDSAQEEARRTSTDRDLADCQ